MRTAFCALGVMLMVAMTAPTWTQEAPAGEEELDVAEVLRQMGAGDEEIAKFQLMSKLLGDDATPLLLMMMMEGKGGGGGDGMLGMLMFMKAISGGDKQPTAVLDGKTLLVVEDGMVYQIDTTTMEVKGSVSYRPPKKGGLPADLLPMLQEAREKAVGASCLSNMKQLLLGALMYAQDFDQMLPTEGWPEQLDPYIKNRAIYGCPGAPEQPIAFALNDALAGAKTGDIQRPAEVVLFFESNLGEDVPFGGPDALLMEPRHGGMVTVGFLDGHCKLVKPDEARKLLEQDPFQ